MILISEFYSNDKRKKAIIYDDNKQPFVVFLIEDKIIFSKSYQGKTFRYAEDAAENFVEGIFKEEYLC